MIDMSLRRSVLIAVWILAANVTIAVAQEPAEEGEAALPSVARAVITSGVVDHQPQDELEKVSADLDRVYCWTDIRGARGQVVEHAWIHEGVTRARVSIRVGSDRWRCYSSKQLLSTWTGDWQVKVFTADGRVLTTAHFTVERSQ